jgi:hypothetical protein
MAQLAEQHGDELAPTAESPRMAFRRVLLDGGLKLQSWQELENLTENAACSIHG